MNLGKILSRSARYWPHNEAVIDSRQRLTYAQLEARSNRLASGLLRLGLAPGAHVALLATNRVELVEAEVAFYKAAMVKVPINARLSPEEIVCVLNDSRSVAVIAGRVAAKMLAAHREALPHLNWIIALGDEGGDIPYCEVLGMGEEREFNSDPADNDLAVLHYTSGSSGVLKAAMLTFGNRKALVRKSLSSPVRSAGPDDVMAHVGPITHASGMQIMPLLAVGACNLLLERYDDELLLQTITQERVTRLFLVPAMVNRLVNFKGVEQFDLSSLRLVMYGAAPMAPALVERAIEVFGPILAQGYGAGETCSLVTVLTEQDHLSRDGDTRLLSSCGRCYFETDLRVVNEQFEDVQPGEIGEIVVKGDDIMKGYWQAPELTAEVMKNGYYHTGDLATVDDRGYVFIVDRKKEMIISGGFNIYPTEVEQVLYRMPGIFEAAVVGVPDEQWGEAVKAVVVLKSGTTLDECQVIEYCAKYLAGFKKPRSVDFINELPKNPNGKIVRRQVRDGYWKNSQRKI
ncbi:long-chain fatty acid--CoA ligase [Serratia marcescens]|uniref:AMP-binding protein n=1 Tax=Serratia marcescens TaxID=615 RepID=UPI00115070E8|nr:AMP-binding protein [Serratia marcescens]QDI18399.1 long-chain fatty acid--CoA ligase [Serratia marcescens]QDI28142.1 long-chain fatty acid--CoA ligase [Serratia marcescens]QDI42649.1 long-chain fatty acid--CoA ligase [Serratia marcescens]QDI57078.1 long-chain fatty acid--CoA ligase [Serratia marcescens]QLJ65631.1 AMP-binding protein [Serratia marcescens]